MAIQVLEYTRVPSAGITHTGEMIYVTITMDGLHHSFTGVYRDDGTAHDCTTRYSCTLESAWPGGRIC